MDNKWYYVTDPLNFFNACAYAASKEGAIAKAVDNSYRYTEKSPNAPPPCLPFSGIDNGLYAEEITSKSILDELNNFKLKTGWEVCRLYPAQEGIYYGLYGKEVDWDESMGCI